MQEKHVLLGIHHENFRASIGAYLEAEDYKPYIATSQEDLIAKARDERYALVIMDANFQKPGSFDISPLRTVYAELRQRIATKKAYLVAFSGNKDAIKQAQKEGLPVVDKRDFHLSDYLK